VLEGVALLAGGVAFELAVSGRHVVVAALPVHSQTTVVPDETATAAGPKESPSLAPTLTVTSSASRMSTVPS